MNVTARILASGPGWRVADVVCTAGARDRPYEEEHGEYVIAAVTRGTFRYRAHQGTAVMAPGAILLGNARTCFECGHEHAAGDRCLSFHFSAQRFETMVAGIPGATRLDFAIANLPPLPALAPLLAEAEAARDSAEEEAFEELGLRLAGAVLSAAVGTSNATIAPSARDEKRVSEAIRLIEANAERPVSIAELAGSTATSPYHFLRTFHAVAGVTPYQYLLSIRLHRAAMRLRMTDDPVSSIAFEAGFNDLSTFNRRFRRVMGAAPLAWRGRFRQRV